MAMCVRSIRVASPLSVLFVLCVVSAAGAVSSGARSLVDEDKVLRTRADALPRHPVSATQHKTLKSVKAAESYILKESDSLLKDSVDDNKVGDFSKARTKDDHRSMNGKFDWLLKASSPLYEGAKIVAGAAQHKIAQALNQPTVKVSDGPSLQEESNTTDTSGDDGEGAAASLGAGEHKDTEVHDELQFITKDKESYFFVLWILMLLVVLAVLGVCILYARQCLGAAEDPAAPSSAPGKMGGGYGTVGRSPGR